MPPSRRLSGYLRGKLALLGRKACGCLMRHYEKQAHLTNKGRNTVHASQSYPQLGKMKMADC